MFYTKIYFILIVMVLSTQIIYGQTPEENGDKKLDETIEWLENKLTYSYYNSESDVHWSNRFFYNKKENTISMRSVSTYKPNSAIKKKVIDRTVSMDQLDAASIQLLAVEENRGRIVEGTVIQISTIGEERVIQRSFNGSSSLKENFLEISIPKYFEDSVKDYSSSVYEKITLAIQLASKIYTSSDSTKNLDAVLKVLTGTFKGNDGSARTYTSVSHIAAEANETKSETFTEREIVGWSEETNSYFRWTIQPHKMETMLLEIDVNDELILFNKEFNYSLTIHGIHDFNVTKNGVSVDYHRVTFK